MGDDGLGLVIQFPFPFRVKQRLQDKMEISQPRETLLYNYMCSILHLLYAEFLSPTNVYLHTVCPGSLASHAHRQLTDHWKSVRPSSSKALSIHRTRVIVCVKGHQHIDVGRRTHQTQHNFAALEQRTRPDTRLPPPPSFHIHSSPFICHRRRPAFPETHPEGTRPGALYTVLRHTVTVLLHTVLHQSSKLSVS